MKFWTYMMINATGVLVFVNFYPLIPIWYPLLIILIGHLLFLSQVKKERKRIILFWLASLLICALANLTNFSLGLLYNACFILPVVLLCRPSSN